MAKKIDKIGRVTSASVFKGTGRDWNEWLKILNKAGAKAWTHQEIVVWLKKKYRLSQWWQQGVTHGFEVATGRRIDGQSLKGDYATVATRTVAAPARKVWKFMTEAEGLRLWLNPMSEFLIEKGSEFEVEGGIFGQVRTLKPFVRVRLSWQETEWPKPSILQLHIVPRPKDKCIVVLTHENLRSAQLRDQMRDHWKAKLTEVASALKP